MNSAEREAKIQRLPRWARTEITKLERERDQWRDMARGKTGGPVVVRNTGSDPSTPVEVGYAENVKIRFELSDGNWVDAFMDREQRDFVTFMGSRRFLMSAPSSNRFDVFFEE